MAICKLNKDLLKADFCGYSLPTIADIYLANYEDVKNTAVADNEVTAITMDGSAKWYHLEPAKGSTSFEDALVVEDSGAKYRTHTLTFTVSGQYTKEMADVLDALSLGRYIATVKTAEGDYLMLGRITGLEAETATMGGGSDSNGMQITLTANTTEAIVPLASAAVDTVVGAKG